MGRAVVNWSLDTFVSSASPSTPHRGGQYVWVTNDSRVGYIHMSSPVPLGATVTKATLRLRSTTTQTSAFIELGRCRARPAYSNMAWTNRASRVTDSHVTVSQTAGATAWEFDVTDHLQVVSNGGNWFGWTVHASNPSGNVRFYSQESGRGPELEVEWSDRPDAPTALNPSGGRVVSRTHPWLTFDVVDVAGDTTLSAVQVQINGTQSMASPDFDSGTVLTSRSRINLAAHAYAGAVQGVEQFWRARARDGAGLWSPWSTVSSFNYEGRGELTMTSPSAAGLTISDDTPVVAWNLSGRTQAAYQVIVALVSWPSNWLWTSGKITADTTSITIPSGKIRYDDRNYRVTVRVWDTLDRVSTPGDPARYEVERDVHFDDDVAVLPVDELFADAPNATPYVELTATRATTPDRWMILRGNEIIHSAEGMDLHVEGTTYKYTDRTAPGMVEARYRFQPVENNERAWGNPVAAVTPDPRYLWISSLDGDIQVPILGWNESPSVEWEPQSQSELLTPLGSRRPLMIRHSLGARLGSVTGHVVTDAPGVLGATASDYKAALAELEARGEQVRLVAGDENVPVIIYDLNMETLRREEVGGVSFSLFQDGEFPEER